jgi:N-acetylmuramate 1-kinase
MGTSFVIPPTGRLTTFASEEKLRDVVRRSLRSEVVTTTKMTGGASTRQYFRVGLSDGRSVVAMFVPEGGAPEEVHHVHDGQRWPFLEVRDLLAEHGIDVPDLFAEDTAHGWLVIEDLGEMTLARWLLDHPGDREAMYRRAVRDLARAQSELATLPPGSVIAGRTFDEALLRWEIDHFREWVLDARGTPLAQADAPRFEALADHLAARVASLPHGFVHRDYQSRNLMVIPVTQRLVWIDFQDACLGPRVYDLVALLNDSYQAFERSFVEARLADYAEAAGLEPTTDLATEFDLVTVQRKMKDAGRFVFLDREKGNSSFLHFVPKTIAKAMAALERMAHRDSAMAELHAILQRTIGHGD